MLGDPVLERLRTEEGRIQLGAAEEYRVIAGSYGATHADFDDAIRLSSHQTLPRLEQ